MSAQPDDSSPAAGIQVEPSHYEGLDYDRSERFVSYWHQIQQVLKRSPDSGAGGVLEVGVGNGFVHRYLRERGVAVHTLDFDARLEPDTVGSVLALPFEDRRFDLAACFETLEHLPWDAFEPAVRELRRVARRYVLLSLPDASPCVRLGFATNNAGLKTRRLVQLPNPFPKAHRFDGQHYWEIGKRDFPLSRIVRAVEGCGLVVEENFRVFELPYHRFISCRVA